MQPKVIMTKDNKYRFDLFEHWDDKKGYVLFIGLNPSTRFSGGLVTRCRNLAKEWGYGGIHVMNLFAFRTPSPNILFKQGNPEGHPVNAREILRVAKSAKLIVACWGNLGTFKDQDNKIIMLLSLNGHDLYNLGLTQQGNPKHAAYVEKGVKPQLWWSKTVMPKKENG